MSSPIPTREERREFLEQRRSGLGSSDMAKIAGLHPYEDAMDVWISKVSPVQEEEIESIHLLRGILLEDLFAELYAEETGRKVRRVAQIVHGGEEWAQANLDRQILASNGRPTGALELKSPSSRVFNRYIEQGVPDHIIIQHQWQMAVAGYEWGSIAFGNLEHERGPLFPPLDREANPEIQEQLMELGARFWRLVEEREPPDPEEWSRQTRLNLPELPGETRTIDDELTRDWAQEVVRRRRAYKQAEEEYEEAKAAVIQFCRDRNVKTVEIPGVVRITASQIDGRSYPRWKQLRKHGALDPNKVRQMLEDRVLDTEVIIESCAIDFDAFEKQGDDYYRPLITPQDEEADDE